MSPTPDIFKISLLGKENIHCGFHLIPYIAQTVVDTLPSSTYVILTDARVAPLYLASFEKTFHEVLDSRGNKSRLLTRAIPPGETSKSREGKADIEDFLLYNSCTRDTVILALGGGVIGDLVGFVAATFMRGVRFVQVPTTLLAMVDSSVGGKTAIDTPHGKNLIGAFWQPEYVFIDAAFLETLDSREFSNGMAEVVKTAAIWDEKEFASLETRSAEIISAIQERSDPSATTLTPAQKLLLSIIVGSISVKAHIVTIDERETGLRNLVNFGHTIGHAIEAILTPTMLHGECVSVGMILEAEVARQVGVLGQVSVGRLTRCLKSYNLPVSLSDPRIASLPSAKSLSADRLLEVMKIDKKNSGAEKKVVLLSRIGATFEPKATVVKDDVIRRALADAVLVKSGIPSKDPVRMATPGSKSISNRALVLAALGKGTCRLKNLLHSDDTQVMMAALSELKGATFEWEDAGETLVVRGGEGSLSPPPKGQEIYLGNAGTAARFLTAVCTLVRSSASDANTVITGNARMKQRPVGPLVDALRANGSEISYLESEGCLPLAIKATSKGLAGSRIQLAASVSSQYVSSILLCAPYASEPITLELTGGQVISQPYIDMTIAMMKTFGINVTRASDSTTGRLLDIYNIPKGIYTSPPEYNVESDASSATYPLAIAAITGTTCTIANIGSSSLQGDAGFAKGVLEPMGCEVIQTETETTVKGPPIGQLRAIGKVDMEPMTDAFLTASVLAAVATQPALPERRLGDGSRPTTTRIVGIANQRVKECNRIKAMIDELAKFGVETRELDDGLEVYGQPLSTLRQDVSVHCYDDHRVAMAFSVLAAVAKGTILEEKRCVEKTWPNWWDDLENKIGIAVEGVEVKHPSPSQGKFTPRAHDPAASIIIIGMRGAGKTFIGGFAADALGRQFIDADEYFQNKHSMLVSAFVKNYGWPAFREAELEVLKELLVSKSVGHVMSLGGGVVETPVARDLLKAYADERGPVVHVVRDTTEIVQYLGNETARPAYGEPLEDVLVRREPWFKAVSNYDFFSYSGALHRSSPNAAGPSTIPHISSEVTRFFRHITGQEPNLIQNPGSEKRSYFLTLTYANIADALPIIDEITEGVDAIELRVDLLSPSGSPVIPPNIPPPSYVAVQLAALRQSTSLPVVFTVRTVLQGGAFPDTAEREAFELAELAIRSGCEYIDVETTWDEKKIRALAAGKGESKIIASWHNWSGKVKWDSPDIRDRYKLAASLGDIVKIVSKATRLEDNFALHKFSSAVTSAPGAKPLIAINMGREGQLSRILNPTLSPVSHPLQPSKAAPGQVSFAEIQKALHLIGELPAKKFYLLGTPISHSPSPTLHNTGFETLGLPHRYSLLETTDVVKNEVVRNALMDPEFGGASVTIPHKLAIMQLLDSVSPHAEAIGAVNTVAVEITADGKRKLTGTNTDWLAIQESIRASLPQALWKRQGKKVTLYTEAAAQSDALHTTALVLGAGGTSRAALYALHDVGATQIYLFNRTKKNAQTLADAFPGYNIIPIDTLDKFPGQPPSIIISTVPASATTLSADKTDALYLQPSIFAASAGGVVIDMAYKPAETPLLSLSQSVENAAKWARVGGVDILLGQGYLQFELWTGRRAPRKTILEKVWERYQQI